MLERLDVDRGAPGMSDGGAMGHCGGEDGVDLCRQSAPSSVLLVGVWTFSTLLVGGKSKWLLYEYVTNSYVQ